MANWKRNNYKFWHSPLALSLILCFLILFGYKIIDLIKKDKDTAHTKELILDKIDALQKRESTLSADIAKLDTDEGKEEIIRQKYQVAKVGEKMVTIVEEDTKNPSNEDGKVSHGFWNWVKKIFSK